MNILRKLAVQVGMWLAQTGAGVSFRLQDPEAARYLGTGATISGKTIDDQSALRVTTAFACLRVLAETFGSVTLGIYERQAKTPRNAEKVDHDLADILVARPNDDMTGLEFREALCANLAGWGNSYAVIDRNRVGDVSSLYPIPTARVEPRRDNSTDWQLRYRINDRGKWDWYPPEKIWHLKLFSYGGLVGLSPIGCAREALALALAGEEFNARLFAQGLFPSMVLKPSVGVKPDQLDEVEKRLQKLHATLLNVGKPYVLPPGTDIAEGIFPPRDAQFLELRQLQVPEICRIFRIQPHKVASLERATNNNIEQLSSEFHQDTMLPYYRRFEEGAVRLFKPQDRKRFFARFNYESLLRADSTARAGLYSILLQNGVFSRNEVRALENRNSVDAEGMDDYTVQSNMTLVRLLEEMIDQRMGREAARGGQP